MDEARVNELPFIRRAVEVTAEYGLDSVDLDALFLGLLETDCRARTLVQEYSEDFQVTLDRCRVRLRRTGDEAGGPGSAPSDGFPPWSAEARNVVLGGDAPRLDSLEVLRRLMSHDRFYHNWAARRLARALGERNMGRYQLDATILRLRRELPDLP